MEIIKKKICLENYKSRSNGMFPTTIYDTYNEYESSEKTDYGLIPLDLKLISKDDVNERTEFFWYVNKLYELIEYTKETHIGMLPCINGVIKYKSLIRLKNQLDTIIRGTKYYRICRVGDDYVWYEISDDDWEEMFSEFDDDDLEKDYTSFDEPLHYFDNSMPTNTKKFFFDNVLLLDRLPSLKIYYYEYPDGTIQYSDEKDYFNIIYKYEDPDGKTHYSLNDMSDKIYYKWDGGWSENIEDVPEDCPLTYANITFKYDCKPFVPKESDIKTYNFVDNQISGKNATDIIFAVNTNMKDIARLYRKDYTDDIISYSSDNIYDDIDSSNLNPTYAYVSYISNGNKGGLKNPNVYIYPNGERYEYYLYCLVSYLLDKKKNEEEYEKTNVEPSIDISLYMCAEMSDSGVFNVCAEEWIPGKKYYNGEYVIYKGEYYRLECKDGEIYYRGYFNRKSRLIEFDEEGNNHWKLCKYSKEETPLSKRMEATDSSKLSEFISYKKTYDRNGEIMPFLLSEDGDTYLYYNIGLPYDLKIGNDGNAHGDILYKVFIIDEDERVVKYFDTKIKTRDISLDSGFLKFEYYMDAILEGEKCNIVKGDEDNPSGIRYVEQCGFMKEKFYADMDVKCNFPKKCISFVPEDSDSLPKFKDYGDVSGKESGFEFKYTGTDDDENGLENGKFYRIVYEIDYIKIYRDGEIANVSYDMAITVKDHYQEGIPFYKDESLIKIHDVNKNINVDIKRGTSSAFERHNILGEVNTMQDLENYRNGFFNIFTK